MMNDLIKDDFWEEVNLLLLKKNFRLQKVLLTVISVYLILDSIRTVHFFLEYYDSSDKKIALWYGTVYPLIALSMIIITIIAFFYSYNGNKMIVDAVEAKNTALFNRGFAFFIIASSLSIVLYSISITAVCINFVIK